MSPQDACEVCGRTFLVGEKVHSYVSAEGRHEVCELCVDRVAAAGWLPADQAGAEERLRAEAERKPGFFGRLFSRPEADVAHSVPGDAGVAEEEPAPASRRRPAEEPGPASPRRQVHELETEQYDVEAEWCEDEDEDRDEAASRSPISGRLGRLFRPRHRETEAEVSGDRVDLDPDLPHGHAAALPSPDSIPEPEHSPPPAAPAPDADASPAPLPDPAGRGMRPRRLQPDLSPESRFERAIARFNSSDAGRTAAGLTRTLGAPSVSVGDHAGSEDVVRVTVAWELTWYQWGVDLGDELRPVFELAKGYEVSEIDAAARQWNASAHEGRIVMVAPRRREAQNGRPVHR
ncbi:MAG: hypothetical protein JST08_06600 [Actinobacteria bacterium]|nr:hypothetical protein [Actinomycetota bacterium]